MGGGKCLSNGWAIPEPQLISVVKHGPEKLLLLTEVFKYRCFFVFKKSQIFGNKMFPIGCCTSSFALRCGP